MIARRKRPNPLTTKPPCGWCEDCLACELRAMRRATYVRRAAARLRELAAAAEPRRAA